MNILTRAIRQRILNRIDVVGVTRGPGSRPVGNPLINRLAVAGLLRLALRWPALSVIVLVSVVAARLMTKRSPATSEGPRALKPL